jgi:hypothetical protein
MGNELTITEQQELNQYEGIIEQGLETFVDVGSALLAIREKKLYRQHGTFEEYCKKRWRFGSRYARHLISAAETITNIKTGTMVPVLPKSERQIRPLTSLEPDQQRDAWRRAVETAPGGEITGKHVQSVVDEIKRPNPIELANKMAQDKLGLTEEEWEKRPDSYLGDCYKTCYAPRIMEKGSVYEYGVRGVYVCTGCGYAYPPLHEPDKAEIDEELEFIPDAEKIVHFSSESSEWYTPPAIIDRAIKTMGIIELDPCSNSHEHPNVPALRHFTQEDDGLSQDWHGRVYMNPPYGREIIEWVEYLYREWKSGRVTEAIALVPARTDTEWFRKFRQFPRCFIWGRLKFSGQENSAPFPSMAVYLGRDQERFIDAFEDIGDVYIWLNHTK